MNNWASTGSGSQVMINGRWVDSTSPEAMLQQKQQQTAMQTSAKAANKSLVDLSDAQAAEESNAMEQADNKDAANKAFAFATSIANARRPVGGGIQRGTGTRSINAATGGLVAANAAARRKSLQELGRAKITAEPAIAARRGALSRIQEMAAGR